MPCSFILLAGGMGRRMGQDIPKQFLQLAGRPVIVHILERIDSIAAIGEIIVVCEQKYNSKILNYIREYALKNNYAFAPNGNTRQESVWNGLNVAKYNSVIIHEAARPFVSKQDFETIIDCEDENCTYGINIPFTVLKSDESGNYLGSNLNRCELVNIQLPQKFSSNVLKQAHEHARKSNTVFTEDSSMVVEYMLGKVKILKGKSQNTKLTDSIDLITGETIYQEYFAKRR